MIKTSAEIMEDVNALQERLQTMRTDKLYADMVSGNHTAQKQHEDYMMLDHNAD